MNLHNFYTILARKLGDENTLSVTLQLNPAHEIFKGHFPKHPVLPGVAMLQIIKELTQDHHNTTLWMQSANRVKFLALVNPFEKDLLEFQLTFQQEESTLKVKNSTTFVDGAAVMQCSLVYKRLS
ncbi:3-hydroxyacyl-ACP dehydratase [Rasiella sp. SM2506]|uniref:ApeI family dehydratase n=1 Tax=Rasiella sp. SM2506 TaxID=3423914 RepID=UPI003D7A42C1